MLGEQCYDHGPNDGELGGDVQEGRGYPASSFSSVPFLLFEAFDSAISSSLASLSPPLNLEVDLEGIPLITFQEIFSLLPSNRLWTGCSSASYSDRT